MAQDYYAVLGVPRGADDKDIKSAYRKLARKYHPDVNRTDPQAESKFKQVSEAYDVLGDPEKRKLYDRFGHNWEAAQKLGGNFQDFGGGGPFGGQAADFRFGQGGGGPFETIFEQFFSGRGGFGQEDVSFEPIDVEKTVEIPLEEIDTGTKRTLTYQTADAVRTSQRVTSVPTTKKVEVTIPRGISDGKKLRVPGKGQVGANGRAGDLYVVVKWAPHERFTPKNDTMEVEVAVPFTTAALGGEVRVPTLRSTVSMRIPPGTQGGQSFRLSGQGIAKHGGGTGDLYARIKITVPKHLTPEQKRLVEQLAELEAVKA